MVLPAPEPEAVWCGGRVSVAVMLVAIAILGGCDNAPPAATVNPVEDPAMKKAAVQQAATEAKPERQNRAAVDLRIPVRRDGRVFIPELGWRDEAEFWELYANEPELLPDSLDLFALHQLRQEYERERAAGGGA